MDGKLAYVVIKEHFTKEDIHEVQCVCLTREKANEECEKLQKEIDPNYREWKVVYVATDIK